MEGDFMNLPSDRHVMSQQKYMRSKDPRLANAYRKADEIFHYWLSLPETTRLVDSFINIKLNHKSTAIAQALSPHAWTNLKTNIPGSPMLKSGSPAGGPNAKFDTLPRSPTPTSTPSSSPRGKIASPRSKALLLRQGSEQLGDQFLPSSDARSLRPPRPCFSQGETSESSWLQPRQLPLFYAPGQGGRGRGKRPKYSSLESLSAKISMTWSGSPEGLSQSKFLPVTKMLCGFPRFFNSLLFDRIHELYGDGSSSESGLEKHITEAQFCAFWKAEMEPFDDMDQLFRLLKQPQDNYIGRDDFVPLMNELFSYHPGLKFLESHVDFHPKYITTVITRIFYAVNRARNGRISSKELRRSNLMEVFHMVDEEENINKITHYFNYEHFYVIFCQFYELDTDQTNTLNRDQLLRHGEHGLSSIIVNRIFDVGPRPFVEPGSMRNVNYMSYEDYIYFLLSEEDKANEHSLKYWFTCCDVDGDGKLTHLDMKLFYDVQMHRMEGLGHEIVPYGDMISQMWDLLYMSCDRAYICLEDLLQPNVINVAGSLFDALFNLYKFIGFEQRDPFLESSIRTDQFEKAWDRFSYITYHQLAAEDEEAGEDLSSGWENDSGRYQYPDVDTERGFDEGIMEDEESDSHWY
eukprot:347295_1